ncbi:helix-turn-helix transcriptional regulator [Burkholderia metallica]|uniref:helix-turn-helix transcriptional regulator n=1 Tax=Burkholderia metallica TaxID=488729 RepID=UPI001CF18744|nr:WYL domain-containing protein [Burkholderia metallica]MCA8001373.1 WYL domain-containing protein [Burkholderia metallica]
MLDREIMQVLPDAAKGEEPISTPDLHRKISAMLLDPPVVKTVHRRLEEMLEASLVVMERRGRAKYWSKVAGASGLAAKAAGMMTHDEALALQTLRRFSTWRIPTLVAETLAPLFDVAGKRLATVNSEHERRYRKWIDKIEVETGSFALQYPEVDPAIFATVSQALFNEQKLEIVYQPRSKIDNAQAKIVYALGLVEVGGLVYLVAAMPRHPHPAMYRLDRFARAAMLPESFAYPRGFRLSEFVREQRQFDFMVEGEIDLRLCFRNGAGDHLLEAPLSENQHAVQNGDTLEIRGTVLLSQRLRWWLRAFGPNVEVMRPASLRAELAAEAKALTALYQA